MSENIPITQSGNESIQFALGLTSYLLQSDLSNTVVGDIRSGEYVTLQATKFLESCAIWNRQEKKRLSGSQQKDLAREVSQAIAATVFGQNQAKGAEAIFPNDTFKAAGVFIPFNGDEIIYIDYEDSSLCSTTAHELTHAANYQKAGKYNTTPLLLMANSAAFAREKSHPFHSLQDRLSPLAWEFFTWYISTRLRIQNLENKAQLTKQQQQVFMDYMFEEGSAEYVALLCANLLQKSRRNLFTYLAVQLLYEREEKTNYWLDQLIFMLLQLGRQKSPELQLKVTEQQAIQSLLIKINEGTEKSGTVSFNLEELRQLIPNLTLAGILYFINFFVNQKVSPYAPGAMAWAIEHNQQLFKD